MIAGPLAERGARASRFVVRGAPCQVTTRPALEAVMGRRPAVLFLDLALPGLGGIGGLAGIQRLSPSTHIVLLTRTPNETQAVFALLAGAKGYCHRDMSPVQLRKAVDVVRRGEIWIGRRVILRLLERLAALTRRRRGRAGVPDPFHELAPREIEIAEMIGGGASNKEIAGRLRITEATVKAHLTSVFRKLGVPDRLRLALLVSEQQTGSRRLVRRRRAGAGRRREGPAGGAAARPGGMAVAPGPR